MHFRVMNSSYHLGYELPMDLTTDPHRHIKLAGEETSMLAAGMRKVALVGHAIRNATSDAIHDGVLPFLWAGDCMAPISVVAALQHNQIQPTIFWFDAHGDFNTRETSCTGYLGGMSLAILVGRTEQGYLTEIGAQAVPENSAVLVDGRRLDPKEAANLSQSQVKHVPIDGIGATLDEVENPVYLHIDVDVINPNEMPGMLYDAYYGPSMIQVIEAAKQILSKTFVCAISIGLTLSNDRREAMRAVAAADVLKKALTSQLEETNHRPPNTQRREKCKYLKTMMPT